jgi:hypothetical protein
MNIIDIYTKKLIDMKLFKYLIINILILFVGTTLATAQQTKLAIRIDDKDQKLQFAYNEISNAANKQGYIISKSESKRSLFESDVVVYIISDADRINRAIEENSLIKPQYSGWQCYSIRTANKDDQKVIFVLSEDKTGALYGGLDVAEAIISGNIYSISDSDNMPYLKRRGIKWNMPLDLRTPNYADIGDHYQENIPNIWELDFWHELVDEMVRSRMNLITLHNIHPFPSIVKVPEFPDVALDDVQRTKVKIELQKNLSGRDLVSTEMLDNYEVVKKISIDDKIEFWKDVMEYAHNLGVEFIWFTWNVFTYGADGKYGINDKMDNDTTIAYYRASVRELVLTYPHLSGIGITSGENMRGPSKYSKEEWLWLTYGLGISDALKIQPDRQFRLIHRFHQAQLKELKDAFIDYPSLFDLSFKYTGAHTYSIPNPPEIYSVIDELSTEFKTFLTVRNDDIYSMRWGNSDFVRKHILSIPNPEKIAGYYLGGYWARDVIEKNNNTPRPLNIQKRWYETMLWGRLGYNPNLSDSVFCNLIAARFEGISEREMIEAWSAASMVFPWITRFSWARNDFHWFPEACYRNPNAREGGFINVDEFISRPTQNGSNIINIIQWAKTYTENTSAELVSPFAVADTLSRYSKIALINLKKLDKFKTNSSSELGLTLGDINAFAAVGNYYAAKIRGACHLALYDFYGLEQDKEFAIQHLINASKHWKEYAEIYSSQYKPALFSRIGYINIPELTEETLKDIEIAKNWKPGTILDN